MYKYTTKHADELKRKIFAIFNRNRLRLLSFNELNLINSNREVDKLFRKLEELYSDFFKKSIDEYDLPPEFIKKSIDEYNDTLMYVFLNEMDRKKSRYSEATYNSARGDGLNHASFTQMMTSNARNIAKQIEEQAIDLERKAVKEQYKEDGVKYVRWVTALDERVCEECGALHGNVYPIDELPSRPHINCRCEFEPVREDEE